MKAAISGDGMSREISVWRGLARADADRSGMVNPSESR
jgi:hypothetical protein